MIAAARALAALTVLALVPAPARGADSMVQAEQFVLRDRQGNVVGSLSAGEGADRPSLVLYDRSGTVRIVLDVNPDGSPAILVADDEGAHRVPLSVVGELLSALGSRDVAAWLRAPRLQPTEGDGLRDALVPRLPYGVAILAVVLLAATALVLLVALVFLDRRARRSTEQFHELWTSVMEDRERERAAYRDGLTAQRNVVSTHAETLDRCADVGADLARALEHMRHEIDEQLRRLGK